jgi:hypothetical protein
MAHHDVRRDHGLTWQARLAEARDRVALPGPRLSATEIDDLRSAVETLDVSSPENMALLWSGRGILTDVRMDEAASDGPRWWDKLAFREAEVFRKLGIGFSVEDTPGGAFLVNLRLNYPEHDPLWRLLEPCGKCSPPVLSALRQGALRSSPRARSTTAYFAWLSSGPFSTTRVSRP